MSLFRTLRSIAFLTISALPLAFDVNAAEPAMPLDVQQRLEVLKTAFDAFVLKSVSVPYEEAIKALNAKAKPALERASVIAAERKDLNYLVRIKSDIERVTNGLLLTETDAPPPDFFNPDTKIDLGAKSASLKNIYAAYRLELAKIESAKKSSLADAKKRYDTGLLQIQGELTAAQNVEAALQVRQLRENLAITTVDLVSIKESAEGDANVRAKPAPRPHQSEKNTLEDQSEFDSSKHFTGKVYSNLDRALQQAKTTNKPIWVIGYGDDDERKNKSSRVRYFMMLEETKNLVNENFIQVMAPFSDKSIQPLIAKEDNLEIPMLFLLNPQGEIIFKRVLNENPEWGLRRTKEYILMTQTDANKAAEKDKTSPTSALAPPPSGKSVLKVEKGQGVSFFEDELEDVQCIRANQGEPVFEWIFGIGKTRTKIKPDKGKYWLSKERDYWKYRSVNEVDKNNLTELSSGEFWINKGESFYAERGGLTVRVTLLEPITRDLVILEIQPVRK